MMWTKVFRKALISVVYQDIFSISIEGLNKNDFDLDLVISEYSTQDTPILIDEIKEVLDFYNQDNNYYSEIVKKYLNKWDKTYDLIKATLVVFTLELLYAKEHNIYIQGNLVGKYVRLAQDFVGGDNPGLVHAVASKIFADLQSQSIDEL